jgi:hypothetical protein
MPAFAPAAAPAGHGVSVWAWLIGVLAVALTGGIIYLAFQLGGSPANKVANKAPAEKTPADEEKAVTPPATDKTETKPEKKAEPRATPRTAKTPAEALDAIRKHLQSVPEEKRKDQRYFTLVHLHNNPKVTEADLRLYREALEKVFRQLRDDNQAVPTPIDPEKTIYTTNLRQAGWDKSPNVDAWKELLKHYPYGLHYASAGNDAVAQVQEMTGGAYPPYVRADWFIAAATRPAVQATLLRLTGKGDATDLGPLPPAIERAARLYARDLGPEEVARELGLPDADSLLEKVREEQTLRRMGLEPLTRPGGTISRQTWERVSGLTSLFQDAAYELGLGTPFQVRH